MRAAGWVFVLCAILAVIGIFVPAVGLRGDRTALAKKTQLSLYSASNDQDVMRRFVASYGKAPGKRCGAALIGALAPRLHGRAKGNLADAHDAMETLDTIKDDDIVSGARAFKIALWGFLAIHLIMALVIFGAVMNNGTRTGTLVVVFVLSVIATAMAIAIYWGCGEAVFQANDELGIELAETKLAPVLIAVADVLGIVALIGFAGLRRRQLRTRTDR